MEVSVESIGKKRNVRSLNKCVPKVRTKRESSKINFPLQSNIGPGNKHTYYVLILREKTYTQKNTITIFHTLERPLE
jgi:hypothetical protein